MQKAYHEIHNYYQEFQKYLLVNGMLLAKDTGIGYWGVTHLPAAMAFFQKLQIKPKKILELGSGDGRVAFVASLFAEEVHGIEFDQWLHETALHIQQELQQSGIDCVKKVKLLQKDFRQHHFAEYDMIYISPDKPFYRDGLQQKLQQELAGKLIVHGWEFFPEGLKLEAEEIIDGEKFRIYVRL